MFCWKCGKPLKGKFCVFCGANVEDDFVNNLSVEDEPTDGFVANEKLDIAVGKVVSDEEFGIREQRYTREQSPLREYRQTREQNPMREESYRRPSEDQRRPRPMEAKPGQKDIGKKRLKPLFILIPLLIIALAVAGWAFMGMQSTRAFNDAMEKGNRYLLAMDLEQAEAHFLRAVEISPREVEPYLLLADVYMLQDEVEQAIDILEQGMEAVSESDREILEDKLEDVIQGVPSEIVEIEEIEEVGEVEYEEEEPLSEFYKALIAFHEFLTSPQTMEFEFGTFWEGEVEISWDVNTLRYARLVDFDGDGIPELLILPPPDEVGFGMHFGILKYQQEQVEMFFSSFLWGDAGSGVRYEVASTTNGKNYLVRTDIDGSFTGVETRHYFTLIDSEFVPVLTTRVVFERHETGAPFGNPSSFYVNAVAVNETEFNNASYEYLGIVDYASVAFPWDSPNEIQPLLRYIEDRLSAVGIVLEQEATEPTITDAEARHQRIMSGDFSDFAGTFTNGHGEQIILHADGRVQTTRELGGEWTGNIIYVREGSTTGIYELYTELDSGFSWGRIHEVGVPIYLDERGEGHDINTVERSFDRIMIRTYHLGFTFVEMLFFKE